MSDSREYDFILVPLIPQRRHKPSKKEQEHGHRRPGSVCAAGASTEPASMLGARYNGGCLCCWRGRFNVRGGGALPSHIGDAVGSAGVQAKLILLLVVYWLLLRLQSDHIVDAEDCHCRFRREFD
ncbi:protein PRRC2A isoform X1 [Babesia caballi]|uniref:Protein PRRC2A isoform X1 n=1 Tax=Babesia caballi TaxID=5871 RepID=A0AAV4LVB7_BABCB|nr:protein PRRC2A isoform X1 [Babesia caballi]